MTTSTEQEHPPKAMGPYLVSEDPPHYLSAVEFSDLPEMVRVLNINKDIFEGTASFEYPYLESHGQARISRAHANTARLGFSTHWAMRTSPTGPLMGWIHVYAPEIKVDPTSGQSLRVGHLGYWVSPEYMRQGYASRSAYFVIHEILFKELGFDLIHAEAYTDNKASRKTMEFCGMQCEVESRTVFMDKHQENRVICCYVIHRDNSTKDQWTWQESST
jgi:RimJ/RimL family protein N-acetyltransferase